MKKYYKILTSLLLLIVIEFANNSANASHIMGLDITYQCLPSGCDYRIYHNLYYDCSPSSITPLPPIPPTYPTGTPNPPPFPPPAGYTAGNALAPTLSNYGLVGSPAGCNTPTLSFGNAAVLSYYEVPVVVPNITTNCDGNSAGMVNGVVGATYYWDVNLCATNCDKVSLTWDDCCSNAAITNITNPASQGIGSNVTTIDLTLSSCNNSPVFVEKPVAYICNGQAHILYQGASDVEGDSLHYKLGSCLNWTTFLPVPYTPGYTPFAPMSNSWDVSIDPQQGYLTILPTPGSLQVAIICIFIEEWRKINGTDTKIGEYERQFQVTVYNNCDYYLCTDSMSEISGDFDIVQNGFNILLNNHVANATDFYWYFDDGQSSNSNNLTLTHDYTSVGVKNVCLLAKNGTCSKVFWKKITISAPSSLQAQHLNPVITILPNPAQEKVVVSGSLLTPQNSKLIVYSMLGTEVYSETLSVNNDKFEKEISISHLPAGSYIFSIVSHNTKVEKLVNIAH